MPNPTYNVRDYGATGGRDDAWAFQCAIDAASRSGGGTVFVPAGRYEIAGLTLRSNVNVVGEGAASVLVRGSVGPDWRPALGVMAHGRDVSRIRFQDLAVDLRSEVNFTAGLVFDDATDVDIDRCHFDNTTDDVHLPAGTEMTLMAVLGRRCRRFRIERCTSRRVQFKVGHGPGLVFRGNFCREPQNHAFSCVVAATEPGHETVSGVTITDNIIQDLYTHGGIYVGTDSQNVDHGVATDIVVARNVVRGTWRVPATGLVLRPAGRSERWLVADNLVSVSGPCPSNSPGISISNSGGTRLRGAVIRGNVVTGVSEWGIMLRCHFDDVIIADNVCRGTRGLWVYADGPTPSRVTLRGNAVPAADTRLYAWAGDLHVASDGPADVRALGGYRVRHVTPSTTTTEVVGP